MCRNTCRIREADLIAAGRIASVAIRCDWIGKAEMVVPGAVNEMELCLKTIASVREGDDLAGRCSLTTHSPPC